MPHASLAAARPVLRRVEAHLHLHTMYMYVYVWSMDYMYGYICMDTINLPKTITMSRLGPLRGPGKCKHHYNTTFPMQLSMQLLPHVYSPRFPSRLHWSTTYPALPTAALLGT